MTDEERFKRWDCFFVDGVPRVPEDYMPPAAADAYLELFSRTFVDFNKQVKELLALENSQLPTTARREDSQHPNHVWDDFYRRRKGRETA